MGMTKMVARRYATALFDLAKEAGALDRTEADVEALRAALAGSDDLAMAIRSPLVSREEQGGAMAAISEAMGLSGLVANLLGLMAQKRRLFALPQVLETFDALLAEHRGVATAEVTAARPLSDAQAEALRETLRRATEREVKLNVTVDPAILGGLVVKVGSRMIDTSIRSKLAGLQHAMKELG